MFNVLNTDIGACSSYVLESSSTKILVEYNQPKLHEKKNISTC